MPLREASVREVTRVIVLTSSPCPSKNATIVFTLRYVLLPSQLFLLQSTLAVANAMDTLTAVA